MPQITFTSVATYAAQFITAAVITGLLYGFQRQYRHSYLRHWVLAWAALAVFHLASFANYVLGVHYLLPGLHPSRVVAALIGGVAGYAQIGWMVFGIYELIRRRPVRLIEGRRTLLFLSIFAVITAVVFLDNTALSPSRHFVRVGVRSILAGAAYLITAGALWQVRKRRAGLGVPVLAGASFFYGLEQLYLAGLTLAWVMKGLYPPYFVTLGYADFLLQAVLAIGMVACLLEDVREATELASVEMEHLAYHDPLTGLPNRPLYMDRLIVAVAQAHRTTEKLGVLFLDLDRFKDINDSLGHSTGDQLLKGLAERIRHCTREEDTLARFGGDEFTLLLPRVDDADDAAKVAQKIIEALKVPFRVHDRELFVSTSIGISMYPTDGRDAETLVRNADTAMYRAKDAGRDNYQLYAPAMNARALERLALENLLRKAISHDELVVHYQPLIDAQTRTVVGVEALVRWHHPELGLLSPGHFISVAEMSGLIIPIGHWVLHTALRQLRTWRQQFGRDLRMSVNLSARQFQQPDLAEQIRAAVDEHNLPADSVELEITETNAMKNAESTIETLRELKEIGVRIAIDDFGTGYSSLNYLKRFPIDTLKVDQSFIRGVLDDASDAAIVAAVISMAHSLNLEVVAEGVESAEQLAFLQTQRCNTIQGYYFSAPLTAADMEPYLMSSTAAVM